MRILGRDRSCPLHREKKKKKVPPKRAAGDHIMDNSILEIFRGAQFQSTKVRKWIPPLFMKKFKTLQLLCPGQEWQLRQFRCQSLRLL